MGTTSVQGAGGVTLASVGYVYASRPSSTAIYADRTGSDGAITEFRKNGTSVGSIGAASGGLTIGKGDTGFFFDSDFNNIRPFNLTTNGSLDATIDLGRSATRFKDLYLSGGANVGSVVATGNVTAYSDIRLKEDIQPIESAASKVQQLTGNTYTRNDLEDTDRRYGGVLAQEVELVLPEAINETEDGIKTVDYNALIALLVESVKELKAEVDLLKGSI